MPVDRVLGCRNYIGQEPLNSKLLNEAKACFKRWWTTTDLPTKERYNDLIALPGGKNDPSWRKAMRCVLLLELILSEGGATAPAVTLARAKREYGTYVEIGLRGVICNRLIQYTKQCNMPAITGMRDAALKVLIKYGALMDAKYRSALNEVFVEGNVNASHYLYCMRWHRTPADWKDRLTAIARRFNTGGQDTSTTDALTLPWGTIQNRDVDIVNTTHPYDRVIEVSDLSKETSLVHEISHWSTHANYQDEVNKLAGNPRRFVHEATTEWLARGATGNMANGGYKDLIPGFDKFVIQPATVDPGDLARAYFGGTNAAAVVAKLRQVFITQEKAIFLCGMAAPPSQKVTYL
jgi:hypothetical protein